MFWYLRKLWNALWIDARRSSRRVQWWGSHRNTATVHHVWIHLLVLLDRLTAASAHAQSDPWSRTADAIFRIFTGPLARAFVVVAVVVSGLTLAFSESGGKRGLAGLIFGGISRNRRRPNGHNPFQLRPGRWRIK